MERACFGHGLCWSQKELCTFPLRSSRSGSLRAASPLRLHSLPPSALKCTDCYKWTQLSNSDTPTASLLKTLAGKQAHPSHAIGLGFGACWTPRSEFFPTPSQLWCLWPPAGPPMKHPSSRIQPRLSTHYCIHSIPCLAHSRPFISIWYMDSVNFGQVCLLYKIPSDLSFFWGHRAETAVCALPTQSPPCRQTNVLQGASEWNRAGP